MKNKTGELIRSVAAIILIAIMCIGTAASVLAADVPKETEAEVETEPETEADSTPKPLTIIKTLFMPAEIEVTDINYTFYFKKLSFDGGNTEGYLKKMPEIGDIIIDYKEENQGSIDADGVKTITMVSDNILSGITFSHAGVYRYMVRERVDNENNESYFVGDERYIIALRVDNSHQVKSYGIVKVSDDSAKADDMVFTAGYF